MERIDGAIPRIPQTDLGRPEVADRAVSSEFGEALKRAIATVDGFQKESEAAQVGYAAGEDVDLHDVLIKVEQADLAFRSMMEVRTKLVDAYREVMRIGSGG